MKLLKIRLERKLKPSHIAFAPSLSIGLALFTSAILFLIAGANPVIGYEKMFTRAFCSPSGLVETLTRSIPLTFCGLSVAFALKAGFWNIGAEGQMHLGAIVATALALSFPNTPSYILLPTMFILSFLAGSFWAFIPALLKIKFDVNEILTTLMMNFVAIYITIHLVHFTWCDRYGFPQTEIFSPSAWLPSILGTRLHLALPIAIILALFFHFLIQKTTIGYEIRVIGKSPSAAKYAGINLFRNLLITVLISGGIAGIAGMSEVSGSLHQLRHDFSPGYGYTGILVAFLSKLNLWIVIPVSILLGGLFVGVHTIQIVMGFPYGMMFIFIGLVLFFLLGGEILSEYKIKTK